MCDRNERIATIMAASLAASVLVSGLGLPDPAYAAGRIVCWKDASGKTIGCGDKVPPEYQNSATRELDSRGITRKQTESAEEANRRRAQEQQTVKTKVEEDRKAIDQRRQDTALLETYSNEKEIDLKRDRDLQVLDSQIEQLTVALKNTTARYDQVRSQANLAEKTKKPLPKNAQDELTRVTAEKQRFEASIQAKQKEKEALRVKYAEYRARFTELRAQQTAAAKK
ncbi:MAG TPA: hypothetical protein VED01_10185 [Burkholderiales bacterium]|nr:hypothetical protein [Burkholderiales bacterium]